MNMQRHATLLAGAELRNARNELYATLGTCNVPPVDAWYFLPEDAILALFRLSFAEAVWIEVTDAPVHLDDMDWVSAGKNVILDDLEM